MSDTAATRLRECLEALRWSQHELARALECDPRQVRRWAADDAPVPENVLRWLEALAAAHARHPPPTEWRRNRHFAS